MSLISSVMKEISWWPEWNLALVSLLVEGEVSRKFDVISKPKNVCLTTETKKNCLVLL